jgi:hypothetical protein
MPPADHPDASAVRRAPTPSGPADGASGPPPPAPSPFSRLLVVGFVVLFLVGALGFVAQVLTAVEQDGASPAPSPSPSALVSAVPPTTVPSVTALVPMAVEDGAVGLAQADVPTLAPASMTPHPSVAPIEVAVPPCGEPIPSSSAEPAPEVPSIAPGASPGVSQSASVEPVAPACSEPSSAPSAAPSAAASAAPLAGSLHDMPFVPVVRFWQTRESIPMDTLARALRGRDTDWARVLIPEGDRDALEGALGIEIPDSVREAPPSAIIEAVKRGNALGILRATDVEPSVRALGIDGRELFGNDRVTGIGRWPLTARVEVPAERAWRQSDTWTLVAGGDSFTDRGIYERVEARGKGVDYPFDGGTARVTGHHICPSCPRAEGNLVPIYRLSGPKGIVRALVKDADLAIANHEQPTPTNWVYHLQGLVFSGKPDLTRIFTRAGIDFLSLANNHIRDYGAPGVLNTIKTLDAYGIRHAGAGKNVTAAARPAYLDVNGVTVGIVSCNQFSVPRVRATRNRAGALTCKSEEAFDAIRAARKRADVLVVFPHWGVEYTRRRVPYQERLAARWERMGVDVVIGAHSHVPGGIGDIDGMPVFYSLGNLIFDQSWSTATMEGVLAEMTFAGDRLVQIRMHPFLTHDQAQPNLLDPARDDGRALMDEIRKASKRISDW